MRQSRRPPVLLWCILFSAGLHLILLVLLLPLRALAPPVRMQQHEEMIVLSSAVRIAKRPHPLKAQMPVAQPKTVHQIARRLPRTPAQHPAIAPAAPRVVTRKPSRVAHVEAPKVAEVTKTEQQTRAFEQTIAQAKAANDPVAGAANNAETAASTKRYRINLQGELGGPQPEGILYPLKRWIDGAYVYYYVRYLAEYADGATENGDVPWPIRFPLAADPFARGVHRMPLPGPPPNYVADDASMTPLTKNCYDHRYAFCPIAHE